MQKHLVLDKKFSPGYTREDAIDLMYFTFHKLLKNNNLYITPPPLSSSINIYIF